MAVFLMPWHLQAADSGSFHVIDMLVPDRSKSVREQTFQRGLNKVLMRLVGDGSVMEGLQKLDGRSYVQRFSYHPLEEVIFNSKGDVLTQRITIHYNGNLIEQYLRDNGLVIQSVDDNQQRSIVHINIEAIDSMGKYNRLESYLTNLSVVESVNAMQTDGEKTLFEIILRGSEDTFLSLIKNDAKLLEVEVEVEGDKTREQTKSAAIESSKTNNALDTNALDTDGSQTEALSLSENNKMLTQEIMSQGVPLSVDSTAELSVDSTAEPVNKTPVYHYRLVN